MQIPKLGKVYTYETTEFFDLDNWRKNNPYTRTERPPPKQFEIETFVTWLKESILDSLQVDMYMNLIKLEATRSVRVRQSKVFLQCNIQLSIIDNQGKSVMDNTLLTNVKVEIHLDKDDLSKIQIEELIKSQGKEFIYEEVDLKADDLVNLSDIVKQVEEFITDKVKESYREETKP